MKHFGDITKIKGNEVPIVDVIVGGSPCQDLSIAGLRKGLSGERSGLFMEQIRIIKEQHNECRRANKPIRPRFMVWENVPGALSSGTPSGEDFRIVLEETARVADADASIPRLPDGQSWANSGTIVADGWSLAWRITDTQYWGKTIRDGNTGNVLKMGTPQRRRRIALVADFRGQTAPEILFEREGVPGHLESCGQTGEDAPADPSGSIGTISFQERAGCSGGGKGILIQHERVGALSTLNNQAVLHTGGGKTSLNSHGSGYMENVSYTLNCIDNHAVAFSQDAYDEYSETNSSATIKQSGGVYGGGQRVLGDTVNSLCRVDYKGAGNQYIEDKKVIINYGREREG